MSGTTEQEIEYLEDSRLSKLILLLIEQHFVNKEQVYEKNSGIYFSFFFIRILNMSMFSHLFNNKEWVKHNLRIMLSEEFNQDKFWMYYRRANKGDVEEQVVRVFKKAEFDKKTVEEFIELAQECG